MKLIDFALHGDMIFSENFEGIKQKVEWSTEDWDSIYQMLNDMLLNEFSDLAS